MKKRSKFDGYKRRVLVVTIDIFEPVRVIYLTATLL